jgi:hypothetical protein
MAMTTAMAYREKTTSPWLAVKKRRRQQDVDRQPGAAGHQRRHQYGHQPVLRVLDGTRRHDSGNAAAEPQHEGNERTPVQAYPVHQPVHDEGRPCQVSRIFKDGKTDIEQENNRHEGQHRPDAADNTVRDQAAEPYRRNNRRPFSEPGKAAVDEIDERNGQCERQFEYTEQYGEEYRDAEPPVEDDAVDTVRDRDLFHVRFLQDFLDEAADKAVPRIRDERFSVFPVYLLQVLQACFTLLEESVTFHRPVSPFL